VSGVHVRLRVGGESYAFGVEHVLEVAELGEIAPVPGAPAGVLGVRNLRGQVLPVFELASVFGIKREGAARGLLVVEHEGRRAGFAIDEVVDVGVLAAPSESAESAFLHGAVLDNGELIGVVDVPQLFRTLAQVGAEA
jgi:purine-binding chemotaxis protein CheW